MSTTKDKLLQYLTEAEATEQALVSTLRAHIAMTPRGEYRDDLERHLAETRRHAQLVRERIGQIGWSFNPLAIGAGIVETVVGQVLAMGKAPLDMVRGMSVPEKLLKNAKDECATEALEIATYTAIEALAREAGDAETAQLAERIRGEEERFLQRLLQLLPGLASDVVATEVMGRKTADLRTTGAADAARTARRRATSTARKTTQRAASTARKTTQRAASTGRRAARAATPSRGRQPSAREPWPGYDEQNATEIAERVQEMPAARRERVRRYEAEHKDRQTVVEAATPPES